MAKQCGLKVATRRPTYEYCLGGALVKNPQRCLYQTPSWKSRAPEMTRVAWHEPVCGMAEQ